MPKRSSTFMPPDALAAGSFFERYASATLSKSHGVALSKNSGSRQSCSISVEEYHLGADWVGCPRGLSNLSATKTGTSWT